MEKITKELKEILNRDGVADVPVNPTIPEAIIERITDSSRVTRYRKITLPLVGPQIIHYPDFILRERID